MSGSKTPRRPAITHSATSVGSSCPIQGGDTEEETNIYERARIMGGQYYRAVVEGIDASFAINEAHRPDCNPPEGETPGIPEDVRKTLKGLGYLQQ